jgi:hypothetical protein
MPLVLPRGSRIESIIGRDLLSDKIDIKKTQVESAIDIEDYISPENCSKSASWGALDLYQFCQIAAPRLVDECHWSCPEVAELSRLSEQITEYFCFHHKQVFQAHGISETEREAFSNSIPPKRLDIDNTFFTILAYLAIVIALAGTRCTAQCLI